MADKQSLTDHLLASATGHFEWPANAVLFHLPKERELLPDFARRLMFQAYLKMAKLGYRSEVVSNADYMSPTGTSPFLCIHIGSYPLLFSDFEKLVSFLETQSLGLDPRLEPQQKCDQEAFISLVRTKVTTAMTYQTWANKKNLTSSIDTHGYSLCWPLNRVVPVMQHLKYIWNQWEEYRTPSREVLLDFEQACASLSQRLGKNELFFESRMTVLDIVVYAHLQACLSTLLPSNELSRIVGQFENLRQFVEVTIPKNGLSI